MITSQCSSTNGVAGRLTRATLTRRETQLRNSAFVLLAHVTLPMQFTHTTYGQTWLTETVVGTRPEHAALTTGVSLFKLHIARPLPLREYRLRKIFAVSHYSTRT